MINTVTILGCGWLGLPLGEYFIKNGYAVKGSTTQPEKLPVLAAAGILPFHLALQPHLVSGQPDTVTDFLHADLLVIDIPPQVEKRGEAFHPAQLKSIGQYVQLSPVQKIIYISSTSVYPEESREMDETEVLLGHTPTSKALLQAEEIIKGLGKEWIILRCGGLMGYNRIPGKYAAGRKGVTTGDVPVNFVHRDDVIRIIYQIAYQNQWNQLFNVVAPMHPKRKEIYGQNAIEFGFALPEYSGAAMPAYKVISSNKLIRAVGYSYKYPDPLYFAYTP